VLRPICNLQNAFYIRNIGAKRADLSIVFFFD
jgi:hypothetical protein